MKSESRTEQPDKPDNKIGGVSPWSEAIFRELADNIIDGVYCIDTDGHFIFMNKALSQRTGIRQEQFPHLHFLDLIDPAYHDRAKDNFQVVMEGKEGIPYELRYKSDNGPVRIVEVHSRPVFDRGRVVGIIGISRDITDRKLAEERIKTSERQFRTLIESIPIGIVIYEGTKYSYVNPAAEKISGYTRDELYLMDVWEIVHPEFKDKVREYVYKQQKGEPSPKLHVVKIVKKSGEERWVERGAIPIEVGEKPSVLITQRDITERRRTEDELAKYREDLEQLVAERTQDLEFKTKALEEVNISLKVLLRHREEDKKELEDRFVMNIKKLIMPFAEKMKRTHLDERQLAYLSIIEKHLNDITSSLTKRMHQFNFTPREVEVASLLNEGKTTKEIAKMLGIANSSINTHRNQIRKKLGISKRKVNLRSHLQSFD